METNIEEIWKDVVGYEGYYKVSSLGRIKSIDRHIVFTRHNHTVTTFWEGKFIFTKNLKGYITVKLCINGTSKTYRVHRIVGFAFITNPHGKPYINHKNGIKDDNRVDNLEWSTIGENMQHAYDTGLLVRVGKKGSECNLCKISSESVLKIRELWQSNPRPTQREIAKMFNMTQPGVSNIITRRNWKHLPDPNGSGN